MTDYVLVSSMYPSKRNARYGIFVKNVEVLLAERGVRAVGRAVICANESSGRASGLKKLVRYGHFYLELLWQLFRHPRTPLYLHFPNTALPLLVACRWLGRKPRLVLNFHGSDITEASVGQISHYRRLQDQVAGYVVPSEFLKEVVRRRLAAPTELLIVSPSGGVNLAQFRPGEKGNEAYDFVFVSRIHDLKGWAVAVDAIKTLSRDLPVRALFVGSGVHEEKLKKAISDLDGIDWRPGVEQSELPQIYRQGKWLLFPSLYRESLALVPLESMAVGTPPIASNRGAPGDYVKNGVNGLSCEPDVVSLEAAMREALEMEAEKYLSICEQASQTARGFGSEQTAEDLARHLKRILA